MRTKASSSRKSRCMSFGSFLLRAMARDLTVEKRMKIFQFKVSLDHVEPPVWRRFVISSDATFGELSDVIQIVMGWTNLHLHEFFLGAEHIGMKDEDSA